jgi:hypothetical protein
MTTTNGALFATPFEEPLTRCHRIVALALIMPLTGCSADRGNEQPPSSQAPSPSDSAQVLSVADSLSAEEQSAAVRGYVLVGADHVTRLCAGLAGSYPPQCGRPSLTVEGLSIRDIPNSESAEGIVWSGETTLRGALAGGVLTVS